MLEINNLKEFLSQSDEYHDITWFEQQADNGNIDAQFEVGVYYGKIVHISERVNGEKIALKMFELAARNGHKQAMFEYGSIFQYGNNVAEADQEKYGFWVNKAENYCITDYVDLKDTLLFQEFKKGYLKGDIDATVRLGICYGIQSIEAEQYFSEAAEKGSGLALYILGLRYSGENSIYNDKYKMVDYYKKASEKRNLGARAEMIEIYLKGELVPQNFALAFEYANDVSRNSNSSFLKKFATFILADMHLFSDEYYDLKMAEFFYADFLKLAKNGSVDSNVTDDVIAVLKTYFEKYAICWNLEDFCTRAASFQALYDLYKITGMVMDL